MNTVRTVVFFVLALASVLAVGLLSGFFNQRKPLKGVDDYAIVFDAGSSGTRMYIYKWQTGFSAARGDELVLMEDDSCITDDNGIDKINTKDDLVSKFKKCISKAGERVPKERRSRTYIFLAATAGMRLLQLRDTVKANFVLDIIREFFSETGYKFEDPEQVKVLSGQEEGTNAWISANYFLNKFRPKANPLENIGILDLGGASTQIAFKPLQPNTAYSPFFDKLKIYGVNYKPFSNSFLCRGSNQVNLMYQAYLLNKNNYNKNIDAACYPQNTYLEAIGKDMNDSACTNGAMFGFSFDFTVNLESLDTSTTYRFNGKSDSSQCEKEIEAILPNSPCSYSLCSFDNTYQPAIKNRTFYAISGYFYTFNNTEALSEKQLQNKLEDYSATTSELCSKSFNELQDLNNKTKSGIKDNFLKSLCFSNTYSLQLLKSYGFKDLKNIDIVNTVEGYTVGWTLGFLINQLNRNDFLPYEEPPRSISTEYYIPFVVLASILTVISVVLLLILGIGIRCYVKKDPKITV